MVRYFSERRPQVNKHPIGSDIPIKLEARREQITIVHLVSEHTTSRRRFDIRKYNRTDVVNYLNKLRPKFRFEHEWALFRKDALFLIFTPRPKDWWEVLDKDIVKWATEKLEEMSKDLTCRDNYRVALSGNTSQERRYRRQRE